MINIASTQLPIAIILTPFFAGLLAILLGVFNKKLCAPIAMIGTALCSFFASKTFFVVQTEGELYYNLGGWIPPIGIEYVIDLLNAMVLVLIAAVSFLASIYGQRTIEKELSDRTPHFYALFLFLITGLLGITITGDVFNIYVLLEVAALSSYALLALGGGKAFLATFNYLMIGTIGACFYLLGAGFLLIKTGTLNMADISYQLTQLPYSNAVYVALILMIGGMFVKMALFPAHGWLANAYSAAPTAVGCIIAPLMTKVSVYVVIRIIISVFSTTYVFEALNIANFIVYTSIIAIIVGSFYALMQQDFRRLLCYLVIAEIGYMMGGLWLGNAFGFTGAVYHLIADAAMTFCLFMAVGAIYYKKGSLKLNEISGLFKEMPITMSIFVLAGFSMVGIPPTAGFFSKWYLISGALHAGQYAFMIALLGSSLVNAIIMFKIIENAFMKPAIQPDQKSSFSEAPLSMLVPMTVCAIFIVLWGVFSSTIIQEIISPINPFLGQIQ